MIHRVGYTARMRVRLPASLLTGALFLATAVLLGAPGPARADDIEIKTFVWRVEPPRKLKLRGKVPDRLLGTMHVPIRPGRRLPRKVETWVKAATRFVMEVDVETADPGLAQRFAAIERGQDLRSLVPAATWPKLVQHVGPMGIDEDRLRRLDPWFVGLTHLPA